MHSRPSSQCRSEETAQGAPITGIGFDERAVTATSARPADRRTAIADAQTNPPDGTHLLFHAPSPLSPPGLTRDARIFPGILLAMDRNTTKSGSQNNPTLDQGGRIRGRLPRTGLAWKPSKPSATDDNIYWADLPLPALRLRASAAASGNSACVMLPHSSRPINDQKPHSCLSF